MDIDLKTKINREISEDLRAADKFVLGVIFLQLLLVGSFGALFYGNFLFAFLSGGLLMLISLLAYKYYRGTSYLRILNAIVLMTFSVILIQQSFGRIEMHFHVFIMLSFLIVYKDVVPLLAASLYIIIHHLLFTYLQLNGISIFNTPIIVFNYGCGYDIALLHAFFVLFELFVLLKLSYNNIKSFKSEAVNKYKVIVLNSRLIHNHKELEIKNKELLRSKDEIELINQNLEKKIEQEVLRSSKKDKELLAQSKEAQEKLNNSIELFGKHVIASSTDTRGIITEVTESFCQISGYSKDELIGKPHNIVRHPDMDPSVYKNMWETIKSGNRWEGILKNAKKNGGYYWVKISVEPRYDDYDNLVGYYSVRHDITSQKVKEEFMANMSHELRTPLNAIIGFSNILSKKLKGQNKTLLEHIISGANSLLVLINDILDLSKIENSTFVIEAYEFNANDEIIKHFQQFEGLSVKKNINFNHKISPSLDAGFIGDWLRISQIILNLISNAIKFTPDNGRIDYEVDYINNSMVITVRDNGIGMDKVTQDRIFKPFEQADGSTTRKYGGTGLGLSITQKLVEMMKGKIELESEEGIGTTFRITLPLVKVDNEYKSEEVYSQEEQRTQLNGHILIAEDNKTNQLLLKMLLEEFGLTSDIANDGLEAIDIYDPKVHSLILMDENMPNMNGLEAMKIIRNKYQDDCGPIIALTANAMKDDRERFLKLGMDEYISKPISEDKLYEVLKNFLQV